MSEEQVFNVPAFIATGWDEDGNPEVYMPVAKCTAEQIRGHVSSLYDQMQELQRDVIILTSYALAEFGETATDTDDHSGD